jgi:transcriptional regulator with XRE-family HTH domain
MSTDINAEKIVRRIVEFRKELGLSLEYVADSLEMSTAAYHKIEKLETKLTVDRLIGISKVMEVPLTDLLGIKVEKHYSQEVAEKGVGHQYNGDIKALYNENSELSKDHISSLKEEINFLKGIISKNGFV